MMKSKVTAEKVEEMCKKRGEIMKVMMTILCNFELYLQVSIHMALEN